MEPKVKGQTSKQPLTKGVFKDPPESLRRQAPKAESAADSASVPKHKGPPIIPGVNKAVKPPPPPARAPPTPQEAGTSATSSRPDPPDLPGAAKGAPAVDRSRSRTHTSPSQIDYSCLVEDERPGIGVHFAFDTVGGRSPGKVTVGLDWHQVISPHGVDRYCYPTPLLVLQLRELAEDYNIQYWVVSFTGHSGARQAKQDISTFVAACVSIHGLPFCGFRITKAPIGPWGKAAIVPELGIQLFVDDRPDIVNEVKRTGIFTLILLLAEVRLGLTTSWDFSNRKIEVGPKIWLRLHCARINLVKSHPEGEDTDWGPIGFDNLNTTTTTTFNWPYSELNQKGIKILKPTSFWVNQRGINIQHQHQQSFCIFGSSLSFWPWTCLHFLHSFAFVAFVVPGVFEFTRTGIYSLLSSQPFEVLCLGAAFWRTCRAGVLRYSRTGLLRACPNPSKKALVLQLGGSV